VFIAVSIAFQGGLRVRDARYQRGTVTTRSVTSRAVALACRTILIRGHQRREAYLGDGGAARGAHGRAEGGETDGSNGRHLRVFG
jgi:hypothetical protein